MTKTIGEIEIVDIVDQDDGSAVITFDLSDHALKTMAQYGLKFVLICAAYDVTIDEALDRIAGRENKE
jgi:hypothetical protein